MRTVTIADPVQCQLDAAVLDLVEITYAGWLWFFGHNMHPWGAFTVKPFMPTVFGEGKVAQFSTFSYPYWGYGLLVIIFVCMMLALLIRRKQLREGQAE